MNKKGDIRTCRNKTALPKKLRGGLFFLQIGGAKYAAVLGVRLFPVRCSVGFFLIPLVYLFGIGLFPVRRAVGFFLMPFVYLCGVGLFPVRRSVGFLLMPLVYLCGVGVGLYFPLSLACFLTVPAAVAFGFFCIVGMDCFHSIDK